MSWEDSKTKELVFRIIRQNQEIILKSVEEEKGNKTIHLAIKNKNSITEIDSLTVDDWKSIMGFLNVTSNTIIGALKINQATTIETPKTPPTAAPIAEPINKPVAEPVAEAIAEPITEPVAESVTEPSLEDEAESSVTSTDELDVEQATEPTVEQNTAKMNIVEAEPVAADIFDNLAAELQKVPELPSREVPVIPSEQVITEISSKPIEQKEVSLDDSVLQSAAEYLSEPPTPEDVPVIESTSNPEPLVATPPLPDQAVEEPPIDIENVSAPPAIPKISEPTQQELESLLSPILKPKITEIDEAKPEISAPESESQEPQLSQTEASQEDTTDLDLSAIELLDETRKIEDELELPQEPVMLNKADELLSTDEKEAKIIAAMEEVAALMPPGPAKKFVEEMMLKRTTAVSENHPRLPQINPETDNN